MELNLLPVAQAVCDVEGLTLVRSAGRGAFKETFLVQSADGTDLALKIFGPKCSKQRTDREIAAMHRCDHPGIARLSSVGQIELDGACHIYNTEEYLAGGTLTQHLRSRRMTIPEVVDLGRQLISAISHIAGLQLVHRDLKPDNIMFRADNCTAVIADFGLVRDLSADSLTPSYLAQGPGTPLFSSPEQLTNDKDLIDWRSDQFSLGLILSLAALNLHPFVNPNDRTVDPVAMVMDRRPPIAQFRQAARQAGLRALEKMVAVWPANRYRTPQQLAQAWPNEGC